MQSDETDSDHSDSDNENMAFWNLALGGAKFAAAYVDLYLDKNPPRTSKLSGMGWLLETLNTPGECHSQLRMSTEIFYNLHRLLVERYCLKPSLHINTQEMLAIFLFICAGNESNRKAHNRYKHSGETVDRTFDEVLNAQMKMSKDFIRPKNPNFPTVHRRISDDRGAYPHFKDCIGALDGTHIRVSFPPNDQVRYWKV